MLKLGLYEQVINQLLADELTALAETWEADIKRMDEAESAKVLGLYMGRLMTQILDYIDGIEGQEVADRVKFCNAVIQYAANMLDQGSFGGRLDTSLAKRLRGAIIRAEAQLLLEIADAGRFPVRNRVEREAARPVTPLGMSSLFTGDKQEPSMMSEIKKEISTSDRIDFLVSFVKYSGLRLLLDELRTFTARGGCLRVITTCYMGATDYKAVEQLAALPNTEVKISYDTRTTRLHAKSYMFYRDTGFSTLYIGSSNMSEVAITSGLEWNVKLSAQDAPDIFTKVDVTFEHYWNSAEFITFVPTLHAVELRRALRSERAGGGPEKLQSGDGAFFFDIQPYYYQQEILDKLQAERELRGYWRNLVIAATGTGKTVISALDYRRFRQNEPRARLLFVAHRKEILSQSLACFRSILRDLNFGDMLVGGETPTSLDHLFVSIQSFHSQELVTRTAPDYYDFIIVDEFHHAAAPSYQNLLRYYTPKVLLGLTATPERADGKSILDYFGGRTAAEMRLYEAIERKLLSPFHYFGVTDSVDLREVGWRYGRYDETELENLFVLDSYRAKQRARYIYDAVERYCTDIHEVVGIGFCVSKRHAEFMADQFNLMGVPSEYLVAESEDKVRDGVKGRLVRKEINFVFVVDLYNEGVDIPEVNTVLFLRPTESLTVYLQQLGRGLRLCAGKEALTVLDFVGHARREYNFEERFKALLPRNRQSVVREMESQFPNVPRGCSIILEKQAQEIVLAHIKSSVNNLRNLRRKVRDFFTSQPNACVGEFFESYHVEPVELYGRSSKDTVYSLAVAEGVVRYDAGLDVERQRVLAKGLERLSFSNSIRFLRSGLRFVDEVLASKGEPLAELDEESRSLLLMFYYTFWSVGLPDVKGQSFSCVEGALFWLLSHPLCYNELREMLQYRLDRIDIVGRPINELGADVPIDLYCNYTVDQVLAALGKHKAWKHTEFREGVLYVQERNLDVFFVTLNKSEKDYSPSTMYHDYAINERVLHWQSQSRTTDTSPTGLRYIRQHETKHPVLFFVREKKNDGNVTLPFTCVGLGDYRSHRGSAPISMEWTMREALPAFVLRAAVKV